MCTNIIPNIVNYLVHHGADQFLVDSLENSAYSLV